MYIKDSRYINPYMGQIPGLVDMYLDMFGYRTDGYFVDIGAFDCYQWSNTYMLAHAGWSGLMVEPQPYYAGQCKKRLKDFPKVKIIELAVCSYIGTATMTLNGSISSIDLEQMKRYAGTPEFGIYFSGNSILKTIEVSTVTTDKLLQDNDVPVGFEVMSIDVEGSEIDVLESFSIDVYKPKLVLVEAHEHWHESMHENAAKINDYFDRVGYTKIYSDHINNVYRFDS